MSTLPDPRYRPATPASDADNANSPHPDLNQEVATLSTKLINAINHQTILDDTLSDTRHELETARARIKELEGTNAHQREILAGDVWVRRSAVDLEKRELQAKVAEERAKRTETDREKKKIEQELENLTAALFEEANKMVIRAKEEAQMEHDAIGRKNDQLKAQLADSESLLKSQQEQLSELKNVMELMLTERDDQTTNPTAPSSPGFAKFDMREEEHITSETPLSTPHTETLTPAPPTSFHHLIQPVLRFDLASYDDFVTLARLSKQRSGSRVSSGSLGGLNMASIGLGGSTSSAHVSNGSTSSLVMAAHANSSAPQSPNTPGSPATHAPIPTLRETRFFKRVLTEDIEPTLRLDMAPGLSWLARRSVTTAITEGTLVVEPIPTNGFLASISKPQLNPCSLCGDSRRDQIYLRTHRFRTSEQESAQRYPLCGFCLNRVRSTCEFMSFLRIVKEGHWRSEDGEPERSAWEESVRLREQMFWARIGGGVVPAVLHLGSSEGDKSSRPSQELPQAPSDAEAEKKAEEVEEVGQSKVTVEAPDALHETGAQADKSIRNSTQTLGAKSDAGSETSKRLSITIPSTE
jgi:hypothetical protein